MWTKAHILRLSKVSLLREGKGSREKRRGPGTAKELNVQMARQSMGLKSLEVQKQIE